MLEQELGAKIQTEGEIKLEDFFHNGQKTENDNSDTPPVEKNEDGKEPSQNGEEKPEDKESKPEVNNPAEEDIPFHKHPRFKALTDEKNQLKQTVEEMQAKLQELSARTQQTPDQEEDIPQWFSDAFGDDTKVWAAFKEYNENQIKQVEKSVEERLKSKSKEEQEAFSKWNNWIESEVDRLKDDGKQFDKNELLKVANDFRPVDEKTGYINFDKAYEILSFMKSKDSQAGKEKADIKKNIISENKSNEPQRSSELTSKDVRYRDWRDL